MSSKFSFQLIARRYLHDRKLHNRIITQFAPLKPSRNEKSDKPLVDHEVIKKDCDLEDKINENEDINLNEDFSPYDRED